jgi:anti-anti-sigma regulatory factor
MARDLLGASDFGMPIEMSSLRTPITYEAEAPMGSTGTCRVVMSGPLSYEAAERLAEVLRWLGPGGMILVDLTGAEVVDEVMLTQLANLLRSRCKATSIRFQGLGWRDVQMLGSLGLHLDASGRVARPPEAPDAAALASG